MATFTIRFWTGLLLALGVLFTPQTAGAQEALLRLELTLPKPHFRTLEEKYVLVTAINVDKKSIRLPNAYDPGPFDLVMIDSQNKKRVRKGFVRQSTGVAQGIAVDFRPIPTPPPSMDDGTTVNDSASAPLSSEIAPDLPSAASVAILSDAESAMEKGLLLKPGESARADIGLEGFYDGVPAGLYYIRAVCRVNGVIVASPWKELRLVPSPPVPEEELQLYAKVAGAEEIEVVKSGEEFLRRFPDSKLGTGVRKQIFEVALFTRDWATVARYAEEIYKKQYEGTLRQRSKEYYLDCWSRGLWWSGRKKEAEDLLLSKHPKGKEYWEQLQREEKLKLGSSTSSSAAPSSLEVTSSP